MIFIILSSSIFSQSGYGSTGILGNGFERILQSPCYNDFSINPGSFRDGIYSSLTPDVVFSKSGQFEWFPSSFAFSIKFRSIFNLAFSSNILYTKNFSYEFSEDSNEWDRWKQITKVKGSIVLYEGFLSLKIKNLQIGFGSGKIMGNSKRIDIFDFEKYYDIYDTSNINYNKGNSYSFGFIYNFNTLTLGTSFKIYNIDKDYFYRLNTGIGLKFNDFMNLYLSFYRLYPSIGITYKNFISGFSYNKSDEMTEKNFGYGFKIPIKKNSIVILNNIRFLDGVLDNEKKSDIDYHIGITFEFIQ
uniref:Uncharacterized protein n=1 Tax=candidate division WOR-3 bacterium TaxID=2052148 RepID=A0A7C4U893_UNCW3